MNAPRFARIIPDTVRSEQIRASDPLVSAWVTANAGAGKTHVLAQRVIRLLLQGVPPGRILCITFTKAAAANMANRVFDTLRQWTALDETALDKAMDEIGVHRIDAAQRVRARQLFALALETPGGLKVQTIHAFCTNLLHLFPFEANVPARFNVLEEAAEKQLLDSVTLDVLREAAAAPDSALGKSLAVAIASGADTTFREMINLTIAERDRLEAWITKAGSVDEAAAELSQTLGIDPADSYEKVEAEFFDASLIAGSEWKAVADALMGGLTTDIEHADRFLSLAKLAGSERLDTYLAIFCTAELSPRKNIVTKTIRDNHPTLFERLVAEQRRVCALIERRRTIVTRDRTAALITIADAVLKRYRTEKNRRSVLDYEDLIDKALDLLRDEAAAWVHYKLDSGIEHVLIDEAQDTSPKQWAIVRALVAEFFAGKGASTVRRTIFAVGDEKQSIFSFQGAAPREFEDMRREFDRLSKAAELELRHLRFGHSFRSGPNVLGAVDTVFAAKEIAASITSDTDGVAEHIALMSAAPGMVEIWEPEQPEDKEEPQGWDASFDEERSDSPVSRLAGRIAAFVRGRWPDDVLILVRRRGALFEAIIRALKDAGVPVAGADRLQLTEHIAVMDLMVLADALLLPQDDLALATVLKSPLFNLSEDDILDLAGERGNNSLITALKDRSKTKPQFASALELFRQLTDAARTMTPFEFYAHVLGAKRGRKRILARLGHEASDALDEFLNLALDYERNETPSLQGFVAWLRAAKSEVKRDMELERPEARVMTVHGAKGLEARTVILADTTTPPHGWHPPKLLMLPALNAAPDTPARLVWAGPKINDTGPMSSARATALNEACNEYRRLLYVAMTRAIERLIVCGVDGKTKRPEGCWYDLVFNTLQPTLIEMPTDVRGGKSWRYCKVAADDGTAARTDPAERAELRLDDWLLRDAPRDESRGATINPSGFMDEADDIWSTGGGSGRAHALARGAHVHRLMQSLPDIPIANRTAAARSYLARRASDFSESERADIATKVGAIIVDLRFASLFEPGSRAEVSIVGRVGGRVVSGQVDRLVVKPDEVLIADYKTNRPAPRDLAEAKARHAGYIAQLAHYRAVLMRLYPGRPVRAALLWTDTADLMEVPAADLDKALTSP